MRTCGDSIALAYGLNRAVFRYCDSVCSKCVEDYECRENEMLLSDAIKDDELMITDPLKKAVIEVHE